MHSEIESLVDRFEQKTLSRRELVTSLIGLTSALVASPTILAQQVQPSASGKSMNHVSLSVTDVNRSADFYGRVLGLEIISRPANGGLNMGLGSESFLGLYQLQNPGTMDLYFNDPDGIRVQLAQHGYLG